MYYNELEFAKNLALEAGNIIVKWLYGGTTREWKSNITPVTEADFEINALVINRVQESFPGDCVRGEESSAETDSTRVWVCDPIDGTIPFTFGVAASTFTLALVVDGSPKMAVIYEPYTKRLFWATIDGSAYLNGEPIHVSNQTSSKSLVNFDGFPFPGSFIDRDASIMNDARAVGILPINLWSTVLAGALVAAGQFSGAICTSQHPHDSASLKLIVECAGGKVTDVYGNDQRYDQEVKGVIASNGVIHDELIALIKK